MTAENTIIFDFDGTLADTLAMNLAILNELSIRYKFNHTSESRMRELRNLPASQVLKALGIHWLKAPWVMRAGKRAQNRFIKNLLINPELKAILYRLKPHCRLGIVTTNAYVNVTEFLAHNDVDLFDFIYADATLLSKNRLLNRVLRKEGLSAEHTIYVGDELRDYSAAQRCNLRCLSVCWGYNSRDVLAQQNPEDLVEQPEQLLAKLRYVLPG